MPLYRTIQQHWYNWNTQYGTNGTDYLSGGAYNDNLYGFDGNDGLWGGAGNDLLDGGNGWDHLYGGTGTDYLYGRGGVDNLFGESGTDYLYGGEDSDWLVGGQDRDVLSGGSGSDTFAFAIGESYAQTGSADQIIDWDANDRIYMHTYHPAGYAEFTANVSSIEDAQYWANVYHSAGWLGANVGNVYVYNEQSGVGYLLADLDNNDASGAFESGVVVYGATLDEMDASNLL